MEYYFAPMEGITGAEYRAVHHRHFPGVDRYYMPFITPTQDRVFTPRELRNISPERNAGYRAVPQLLTKNAGDFNWAAGELFAMGYDEVDLNLGCPSGTVTAKGKGAGMLADLEGLDRFLDGIFSAARGKISVKTRLGLRDPEEIFPLWSALPATPSLCSSCTPECARIFTGSRCGRTTSPGRWRSIPAPCAITAVCAPRKPAPPCRGVSLW